jgi:hypothetical protein
LRDTVKPQQNRKATLLLSHHEYFTAFSDHDYTKPAKQLMEFFKGQEVVWIWGHEHRLGIYEKFGKDGGITVFGRCLGHGGTPVDLCTPISRRPRCKYYDPRSQKLDDGTDVGQNGYMNITIRASHAHAGVPGHRRQSTADRDFHSRRGRHASAHCDRSGRHTPKSLPSRGCNLHGQSIGQILSRDQRKRLPGRSTRCGARLENGTHDAGER